MRRDNKRVKKPPGSAGAQPPASAGGTEETMNDAKGQLVTLTGGLAQGAGRPALTAAEFQELSAVPLE